MSNTAKKARNVAALSGGALVAASPLLTAGAASAVGQTFTVTSLTDDGTGVTLREAIESANADATADTIQFQAGLNGTITLTGGRLDISESVTITGPGASALTIDGNGGGIFFSGTKLRVNVNSDLHPLASVTLISGNTAANGGGIAIANNSTETVHLHNLYLTGNEAVTGSGG